VRVDPELDAAFPRQRGARVTMRTHDGRSRTWLQPTRKGDPDAPLSDAELDAKLLELAAPVCGRDRALALRDDLWRIDTLPRLDALGDSATHTTPTA
jgi:2-methylcitrate dehydratase PrpD